MKNFRRTMLFMPGNNPGMLFNAAILGADSIILDLEDAVSISEKDSARILVKEGIKSLSFEDVEVVVRINPLSTEFGLEDLEVIGRVKPDSLMIPKATEEDMKEISSIVEKIEKEEGFMDKCIKLIPIIESAYSLENVYEILKSSSRIKGVLLGGEDLATDLGIKRTKEGEEIFYARSKVATAAKALRIDAIDTPFTDIDDYEGLRKDTLRGKHIGMTGKASINPRQIDIIHEVFNPSEEDIIKSKRIVEAMNKAKEEGLGVFSLDGKMVDAPIINRAINILKQANELGLI